MVKLAMVGLVGGKGGFGAALRAMAKQAGDKKTTDFGACRDLQVDTSFCDLKFVTVPLYNAISHVAAL